MLNLLNRNLEFDHWELGLLEEKLWQDPDFDPNLALVAREEGAMVGFIMAVMCPERPQPLGFFKIMTVASAFQRQGRGRGLLQRVEANMRRAGVKEVRLGESAPNYWLPGVDARYQAALSFFEKEGYQRIGKCHNLEVDLNRDWNTQQRESKWARRGLRFCRVREALRPSFTAFLKRFWPSWLPEIRRGLQNHPPSVHLALENGAVIGFAAYDCNNVGTGWFGPMGVHPHFRGRGIGAVLLKRCLGDLAAQGRHWAIIPWVGPSAFYKRVAGARVARVFIRFQKNL